MTTVQDIVDYWKTLMKVDGEELSDGQMLDEFDGFIDNVVEELKNGNGA